MEEAGQVLTYYGGYCYQPAILQVLPMTQIMTLGLVEADGPEVEAAEAAPHRVGS